MKKLFRFLPFVTLALLMSCQSEDEIAVSKEDGANTNLREITINVKGFQEDVTKATGPENPQNEYLYYTLLLKVPTEALPVMVHERYIPVKDNNYNLNVTENLPDGNYIVGIAYVRGDDTHTNVLDYVYDVRPDSYISEYHLTGNRLQADRFAGKYEFSVTKDSPTTIDAEITLSRIVGKVEVVIKDAKKMPSSLNSINTHVSGFLPIGFIISQNKTGTAYVRTDDFIGIPSAVNVTDKTATREEVTTSDEYTFSFYIYENTDIYNPLNESLPTTDIYILKSDGSKLLIKKDIKIERNKTVRLSGNLFDTVQNNPNIVVNNVWGETIEENF